MKNTQKKPIWICSQIYIFKQKSPNAWPVIDIRQLELLDLSNDATIFYFETEVYLKRRLFNTSISFFGIFIFISDQNFILYTGGGLKKCHLDLNSSHALA